MTDNATVTFRSPLARLASFRASLPIERHLVAANLAPLLPAGATHATATFDSGQVELFTVEQIDATA